LCAKEEKETVIIIKTTTTSFWEILSNGFITQKFCFSICL